MKKEKMFSVRKMCLIGMMAALVLVFTFIKIDIPTALGKTMLHLGNVMCLLTGLLFGPLVGGLASGFGSLIFDLFDPVFAPQCWITFINKFMMAFVAGSIAMQFKKRTTPNWCYVLAAIVGSLTYTALYLSKTFIFNYFIQGIEIQTVLIDLSTKAVSSLIGGVTSVTASFILFMVLRPALKRAKLFQDI